VDRLFARKQFAAVEQEKITDGIEMIETQPGISMPEALGETYDA
jgi:hypothetical protein